MSQQYETISAAQSFGHITAQELQDLYVRAERNGRTPTAYVVDGDMTATYSA